MTFSPDQIGDKHQRYEIKAIRTNGGSVRVGWSNDPDAFAEAVRLHPGLKERVVIDRGAAEAAGGEK